MEYHKPTALYKEMKLLEYIAIHQEASLPDIARYIESAVSMVHKYIETLESEGKLKRDYQSLKVVRYTITAEGIKQKNFLQINYMRDLLQHYQNAQSTITFFLNSILEKGLKCVLLYGAGEASKIFMDMIHSNSIGLNVKGMIDDDVDKQGTMIKGIPVWSPAEIETIKHDGIVITSYAHEQIIISQLESMHYNMDHVVKYFKIK